MLLHTKDVKLVAKRSEATKGTHDRWLIPTPGWLPQFLDSGALYHCPQSSSERREGGAWKVKVNTVTGVNLTADYPF